MQHVCIVIHVNERLSKNILQCNILFVNGKWEQCMQDQTQYYVVDIIIRCFMHGLHLWRSLVIGVMGWDTLLQLVASMGDLLENIHIACNTSALSN